MLICCAGVASIPTPVHVRNARHAESTGNDGRISLVTGVQQGQSFGHIVYDQPVHMRAIDHWTVMGEASVEPQVLLVETPEYM